MGVRLWGGIRVEGWEDLHAAIVRLAINPFIAFSSGEGESELELAAFCSVAVYIRTYMHGATAAYIRRGPQKAGENVQLYTLAVVVALLSWRNVWLFFGKY